MVGLLFLLLTGCTAAVPGTEIKTDSLDYKVDSGNTKNNHDPVMLNVDLPVGKLVITSGKNSQEFEVELASTAAQRQIGLMNRKSLDQQKGMLFLFESSGYVNFWMKDTLFPLDMLFIDEQGYIKHIAKNALPCLARDDRNCPLYNSEESVKYVLEVNAGTADKFGIKAGDKVS